MVEMLGVRSLTLAVGAYLSIATTLAIFVGGVMRWMVDRAMLQHAAKQRAATHAAYLDRWSATHKDWQAREFVRGNTTPTHADFLAEHPELIPFEGFNPTNPDHLDPATGLPIPTDVSPSLDLESEISPGSLYASGLIAAGGIVGLLGVAIKLYEAATDRTIPRFSGNQPPPPRLGQRPHVRPPGLQPLLLRPQTPRYRIELIAMSRVNRKKQTTKSEHWLRCAVANNTETLNRKVKGAFGFPDGETIEWLSPIAEDDWAEYRDQSFLDRLGAKTPHLPLQSFWPALGPQWDGLARTNSGKYLLVEAKAYPAEARTRCAATSPDSVQQIAASLSQAKTYFKASPEAAWESSYYQYANRLAHLYFMRDLNKLDAYLLFLNFVDAPDVDRQCATEHWIVEEKLIKLALGLNDSPTRQDVGKVMWRVPDLLEGIG